MLKRILILIALMIVLVALNWFEDLVAQDLGSLTEEQKTKLIEKYRQQAALKGETGYYQTPAEVDGSSSLPPAAGDSKLSLDPAPAPAKLPPHELRPFGIEFFALSTEMAPPADIASLDDYVLGPGDNLIIFLWGRVEKEYNLTVDREGKLFIPTVGELTVWGLSLEQFTQRAQKRFAAVYSDFELTCSLGRIRSIRIFITGEVQRPGAYTVSSLVSLFNALSLAGGPNERGSMRLIKLMKKGQPKATVDLYRLLLEGDNSTDIRLESGDVIFVPVAGARVAIEGEIKRPGIYELKGGETAGDLLALAGNPTAQAYLDRILLERVSDYDHWEVLDLNLNPKAPDGGTDVTLKDGDHLKVNSIFQARKNLVALFGLVKHPGYYERNDSTRVSDIVDQSQLQPYDVYYERVDLYRRHRDRRVEVLPLDLKKILQGDHTADILLCDHDSIHVYSIDDVRHRRRVYIEGEVNRPGWYPLYDGMSAADLVFLAGSYTRSADLVQAELARIDENGEVSLEYFPLDDLASQTVTLREDDHMFVRSIPQWQQERSVTIEGEVLYPGEYVLRERSETLCQLLARAGGFTAEAFPKGLVLERVSIEDDLRRANLPRLLANSQPLVIDSLGRAKKQVEVDYDPAAMNRIIIDTDKLNDPTNCESSIALKPNDRIYVPTVPTGVPVIGAVGANGTIGFDPGRKAKFYIKRAGDFTRRADKKEVRIVRAGGEVISGGVLGKRIEVGDMILVPTRIQRDHNWSKTVTTWLSAATGVLTSVFIISKL